MNYASRTVLEDFYRVFVDFLCIALFNPIQINRSSNLSVPKNQDAFLEPTNQPFRAIIRLKNTEFNFEANHFNVTEQRQEHT